jgi:hypothetical protein
MRAKRELKVKSRKSKVLALLCLSLFTLNFPLSISFAGGASSAPFTIGQLSGLVTGDGTLSGAGVLTVTGLEGHTIGSLSGLLKLTNGVPSTAVSGTDYQAAYPSGAHGLVVATPAAVPGVPGERALVATDIPALNYEAPQTSATGYGIVNGATIDSWGTKTPPNGTVVGTTDAQTLTNKTLTSPVINGGSAVLAQVDAHTAVTTGSVAIISGTPVAQGSNYTQNDLVYISTGSGDAVVQCTTVSAGACTAVALVSSGSSGYSTGTGQATAKDSCSNSACAGLQVNITAVGLTPAQVSNTYIYQSGQAASPVTNYLPTAEAGYGFMAYCGTAQTSNAWSLAGNSGTLNNASGGIIYYNGVAGTAGSSHGIQIVSPAVDAMLVCTTRLINPSGTAYYVWSCTSSAGAWAQY